MKLLITILLQSLLSALAVTESGDTLVNINCTNALVPASNMKVVTTGLALNRLGSSYRWETKIGYSGSVEEGVLHGDLYIVGGADPTLGSKVSFATPLTDTFAKWADIISEAGIYRIDGHIVGDGRYLEGPMEDPTWLWEDLGTYYGCGVSGLSFYENGKDFEVAPGDSVGAAISVKEAFPPTPWMTYSYDCSTGKKGTGDKLYLYTTRLAPAGSLTGTFALDRKPRTENCSNKYPEYTCANCFFEYLESIGVECTEGPADIGTCFSLPAKDIVAQKELVIIGKTASAPLGMVINETNFQSNNFMAECLFRTLGKEISGNGDIDASRAAIVSELKRLGINPSAVAASARIKDGSGLSRGNYISPAFFCKFLRAMMKTKEYPLYLSSLPMVGVDGTVRARLQSLPMEQRRRVRMKSGSMDGVRCYCGYILPTGAFTTANPSAAGKTIIFSYMVNNSTDSGVKLNADADQFISSLLKANL